MASAYTTRLLFAALLLLGATRSAQALQLGETRAQTLARHGGPGAEDRKEGVAIYYWDGWSAEAKYESDAISKLLYRRVGSLKESEIAGLLDANGGRANWRETTSAGEQLRRWQRNDGAIANCLVERPMIMTFQAGPAPPAAETTPAPLAKSKVAPTIVVAGTAPETSTPPTTVPKLVESAARLDPEPTPKPLLPSTPRALPKLQAEEIGAPEAASLTEIPPATAASPEPAAAVVLENSVDETADALDNADAPATAKPESGGRGMGFWLSVLFLLGAATAGVRYLIKARSGYTLFKSSESRTPAPPPRRSEPRSAKKSAAPATTTTLALDALRPDQYELLVGEIFRREGYRVELSAAATQDDSIDLTLRRDGETILVQCKHWKMARVTDREVKEFHGAMTASGAPRGIFVTTGTFTAEAQAFAEGKDIDLMDRAALEECTAAVARPGENFCEVAGWAGEFAANAQVFDPECPICRGTMVIHHHRSSGAALWNCRNHPRCPGRREPRRDLLAAVAH